ncbi:MAG: YraN family protein [Phycisphaeraceae bacterium]|nr:YraN family protein [Phycisphaeraceae bacterium]
MLRCLLARWREGEPPDRATLGRRGERAAARRLCRAGYRVLGRNIRIAGGEADIVCLAPDRSTIVIVEVKTRLRRGRGGLSDIVPAEAAVNADKRRRLAAIARGLARANGWSDRPVRIDVVAIDWPWTDGEGLGKPNLKHIVGVIGP